MMIQTPLYCVPAQGVGAGGLHFYKFSLDFYGAVDEEVNKCIVLLAKVSRADALPGHPYY